MYSKIKSMGHPIHPMLVTFPLGLLITSIIFDIIHLNAPSTLSGLPANPEVSHGSSAGEEPVVG